MASELVLLAIQVPPSDKKRLNDEARAWAKKTGYAGRGKGPLSAFIRSEYFGIKLSTNTGAKKVKAKATRKRNSANAANTVTVAEGTQAS